MRYPNRANIPQDFAHEAALGNVPFRQRFILNGWVQLGTAGIISTAWPSSNAYVHQASASTVNITAGGTGDSFLGSGARTLLVEGIGASGFGISEVVNMNSGAGVATVNEYLGVNCLKVLTAGATGTNETLLTATFTGTGNPANFVRAGQGQSQSGIYRVPTNMRATLQNVRASGFLAGNANPLTAVRCLQTIQAAGNRVSTIPWEMQAFGVQAPFDVGAGVVFDPGSSIVFQLTPSANNPIGTVVATLTLGDIR